MSERAAGEPGPNSSEQEAPDQRIVVNTVSRYISMSVTMMVSFLLLPFLLRHIGKSAYALQSLAHQSLEFVTMLAFAIGTSYSRIATTHYARGEYDRMNATLSAGLALSLIVAVIIVVATCLVAAYAGFLFDMPPDLLPPARWVLCIFGAGSALQIISAPYRSSVYMTQRLYLNSVSNMLDVLIPAALIIPLFIYGRPSIMLWVGLSVGMRLISLWGFNIPMGRRGLPQMKIRLSSPAARHEMRELVHFGGLALIGSLGALLYYATDAIMISNLNELGIQHVVNYNVAQRWYPQVSMFAAAFVLILGPAMTTQVAIDKLHDLRATVTRATRYCFTILALPCLLLIVQAEPFLRLWLRSAFVEESVPVMRIIMCALLLSGAGIVAKEGLYACRKIKAAVIATLVGGVLNVAISIALVKVAGMGLRGIALGSMVSLILLEMVCLPVFLCKAIHLRGTALLRGGLRAMLGAIPLAATCLVLHYVWVPTRLLQVFIQFAICGLVYLPAVWFISMTHDERQRVWRALHDRALACIAGNHN